MTSPSGSPRAWRVAAMLVWALFMLGLVEATARAFWRIRFGVGFLRNREPVTAFYPELRSIISAGPSRRDTIIDVLMLGGSTLHTRWGSVPQALTERLALATRHKVRVFSLGQPAQTSRDSWYKYRALAGVGFDAVVIYEGFNEVRANNVPPALFHDDYSHYAYYETLRDVLDRHRLWPLATPYTIRYIVRRRREHSAARPGHPIHVPVNEPDSTWTAYGSNIRTAGPLRHNLEAILDLAAGRSEPVVLMTFAAYFAPRYSKKAFKERRLDYATHQGQLELWGRPENVAVGISAHNTAILALHTARPGVGFLDMAAAMPHERQYFNDVCHFTVAGSERFAELLLPSVLVQLAPSLRREVSAPEVAAQP